MWHPTIKTKIFKFSEELIIEYYIDHAITYCGDLMMIGFSFD